MPSDSANPAVTPSSASSQEASMPVQATASNMTKKSKVNSKTKSSAPNNHVLVETPLMAVPADTSNSNVTILMARLAEQEGKYIFSR